MKYLDYLMLQKILRRVLDDVSIIRIDNVRKFPKLFIENWVTKFRDLNEEDKHSLINSIFDSQSRSIQLACEDNIDSITIPAIGRLRLNKTRQDILNVIAKDGSITDDRIQEIISSYVQQKEKFKLNPELDIKIVLK